MSSIIDHAVNSLVEAEERELNDTEKEFVEEFGLDVLKGFYEMSGDSFGDIDEFEGSKGAYNVKTGHNEWLGFKTFEDAESYAMDIVKDQIETDPESFSTDFIKAFIKLSPTDARIYAQELADGVVEGMSDDDILEKSGLTDDDEILAKAGITDENIEDKAKANFDGDWDAADEDAKETELSTAKEELLDDAKEKVLDDAKEAVSDEIATGYEQSITDDPMDFFVNAQGLYTEEDFMKQFGGSIDTDAASVDAVNSDGVAHFLASYDGDEGVVGDTYWYRTNHYGKEYTKPKPPSLPSTEAPTPEDFE